MQELTNCLVFAFYIRKLPLLFVAWLVQSTTNFTEILTGFTLSNEDIRLYHEHRSCTRKEVYQKEKEYRSLMDDRSHYSESVRLTTVAFCSLLVTKDILIVTRLSTWLWMGWATLWMKINDWMNGQLSQQLYVWVCVWCILQQQTSLKKNKSWEPDVKYLPVSILFLLGETKQLFVSRR